jgi:tetratricopeptide (TPR) repeat protein
MAWFAAAGGLVVGLLIGTLIGMEISHGRSEEAQLGVAMPPGMGAMPPGMGGGMPGGLPPGGGAPQSRPRAELEQAIATSKLIVEKSPAAVDAWVTLGDSYFDLTKYYGANLAKESIDAYGRALKLQPRNPNVLTDQGAMFEATLEFDKALANFEAAQKIDPNHVQSLFNMGIIYRHKKDNAKAAAAFKQVIERAPSSPQAADARALLSELGR